LIWVKFDPAFSGRFCGALLLYSRCGVSEGNPGAGIRLMCGGLKGDEMKTVIFLVVATALGGALSACAPYGDSRYAAYQRHTDEGFYTPPTAPQRSYYSRDDYYRHYNGIDG
jgi:hypothetical protein